MTLTIGIHDIPFRDYLDHPGYGSSDLRAFRQGPPAMVPWRRGHRTETASTRLGSAAHSWILTPDLFDAHYWVKPEGLEFRSKENKELRDSMLAKGMTILDRDELLTIEAVCIAVKRKLGRELHRERVEQSVFWRCSESGILCKSRPDWFDRDAIYDLKVSIVADKPAHLIPFAAHANGWLHQLANGRAGLAANGHRVKTGRIVLVSPNAPHNVHLLEVRENDLDFLEMDNQDCRKGIAACEHSGHWPGTPDTWQPIELPASAAFTESDLNGAEEALVE
jgi:exodeoxyribonuclease VIII